MTWTSTGTFFWVESATVTGTSPPPAPLRPPPFPPPPPPGAADVLAPELPQPASDTARAVSDRIQRSFWKTRGPLHPRGASVGIRRIKYWRQPPSYSYVFPLAMAPKSKDFGTFRDTARAVSKPAFFTFGLGVGS